MLNEIRLSVYAYPQCGFPTCRSNFNTIRAEAQIVTAGDTYHPVQRRELIIGTQIIHVGWFPLIQMELESS